MKSPATTIRLVLDEDLLRATDQAAERAKVSRSALVRDALRQHLKKIHRQELERQDRHGYEKCPDTGPLLEGTMNGVAITAADDEELFSTGLSWDT